MLAQLIQLASMLLFAGAAAYFGFQFYREARGRKPFNSTHLSFKVIYEGKKLGEGEIDLKPGKSYSFGMENDKRENDFNLDSCIANLDLDINTFEQKKQELKESYVNWFKLERSSGGELFIKPHQTQDFLGRHNICYRSGHNVDSFYDLSGRLFDELAERDSEEEEYTLEVGTNDSDFSKGLIIKLIHFKN